MQEEEDSEEELEEIDDKGVEDDEKDLNPFEETFEFYLG